MSSRWRRSALPTRGAKARICVLTDAILMLANYGSVLLRLAHEVCILLIRCGINKFHDFADFGASVDYASRARQ
jgi:hypothetical protein